MEMPEQRLERYKQILLEIILRHLPSCKIYLFGSRAQRKARPGSDVDIALDAGSKIDNRILMKIQNDIEDSVLPLFVDVVDLHSVKDDFKDFIKKDFVVWKN